MTLGIRNTRVDVFNISALGTKRVNHRRSLLQYEPTAKNPVIRALLLLLLLLFPFSTLTPTGSYGYAPAAVTGGWLRPRVLLYSRLKRASEVKSSWRNFIVIQYLMLYTYAPCRDINHTFALSWAKV